LGDLTIGAHQLVLVLVPCQAASFEYNRKKGDIFGHVLHHNQSIRTKSYINKDNAIKQFQSYIHKFLPYDSRVSKGGRLNVAALEISKEICIRVQGGNKNWRATTYTSARRGNKTLYIANVRVTGFTTPPVISRQVRLPGTRRRGPRHRRRPRPRTVYGVCARVSHTRHVERGVVGHRSEGAQRQHTMACKPKH
jgi:hypothetical protein